MKNKTINDKLTQIFRIELDDETLVLNNELSANDVDNWDSLTHMIIISEIESTFNIKFKLKELIHILNIGKLIDSISFKIENAKTINLD